MAEPHIIVIFDDVLFGHNAALRNLACETEDQIRKDGYVIHNPDCNGFVTWVMFDDEADAVVFRLKYMTYHVPVRDWVRQWCV